MSRTAKTAKVVSTLLDYEGPQLLALQSSRRAKMLAVAVKRENMKHAFFGCELRDKIIDRYFDEKIDLNFAFRNATGHSFYFFDLAELKEGTVSLALAAAADAKKDEYWPAQGFFAHLHEDPFREEKAPETATRTFLIDGDWDASDFSRFHGKMSEIYALFASINRFDGTSGATEKGYVSSEINQRYWEGGGSYGSFFDSLESHNALVTRNPLKMDGISYHSPGSMIFRGNEEALAEIDTLVRVFEKSYVDLRDMYKSIHGTLKHEGLLRASKKADFSAPAVRTFVKRQTTEFAEKMKLGKIDDIYLLCNRNVIVFAKVILSIFRRAEAVYQFHAEGRVRDKE